MSELCTIVLIIPKEFEERFVQFQNNFNPSNNHFKQPVSTVHDPFWGEMLCYRADWIKTREALIVQEFRMQELKNKGHDYFLLLIEEEVGGYQYWGNWEIKDELGLEFEWQLQLSIPGLKEQLAK